MAESEGDVTGSAPWAWLELPPPHHRAYVGAGLWREKTLGDLARERAERDPDALIFPNDPARPTYASLLTDAEALAVALGDLGMRPGEVVSFQTPNWIEAAVINLSAALGGFVINPIVTIYRDAEVRQMLGDCGARVFLHAESFRNYDFGAMIARIRPDLPALRHVVPVRPAAGGGFADLVASGRGRTLATGRVDPGSVKIVLYTSGTTGRAKGVLHSHNSLERASAAGVRHWAVREGDAILVPSPVTHVSGYTNGLEYPFQYGTRSVMMEQWNAVEAIGLIEEHRVRGTVAATPFLQELATRATEAGTDLSSFRFFACGGAAIPPEVIRGANAQFGRTVAFRVFGSSEVPIVTLGFPHDAELAAVTDGQIVDYDVRIVDDEDADVPPGGEGEILARGPAMMLGYADAEQTREAITTDGYFRTGDLGRVTPDNAILVTGRKKDLIIRGGENLSAKEIEDVLHGHPDVAEAAIVAMPHPRLGEGVCAFIIPRGDAAPGFDELVAFVAASGLAPQKRPERIEIVDVFPRTASGKIRKDVLRSTIAEMVRGGG